MSKIDDLYGGGYLVADDVPKTPTRITIGNVRVDSRFGKVVVSIIGEDKEFSLNKTNAIFISKVLGDDYYSWTGAWLEVQQVLVNYLGQQVPGIRVVNAGRDNGQPAPPKSAFAGGK